MSHSLPLKLALALTFAAASPLCLADDPPPPITTQIIVDTNTTWAGDLVKYLKTHHPEVRIQTSEFLPGATTVWHIHEIPGYIYVLSGTFRVELLDGRVQQWNAGQGFVEVVNTAHRGVNPGTENAKLLIVYTGEEGTPFLTPLPLPEDEADEKDRKNGKIRAE
jgi:quercetin dioxygenase-like cupin family protein